MNLHVDLRKASPDEVVWLHKTHMERDFPPAELKPLPLLLSLVKSGINSVWLCESRGKLVGYAVLAEETAPHDLILLDYLAVMPELRDSGWGSAILKALSAQFPALPILIESEHPDPTSAQYAEQVRRIRFYKRAGCSFSEQRALLFGVDYELLLLGGNLSGEAVQRGYLNLYREMLPPDWFAENVSVFADRTDSASKT